jgi:hypothetical protein
VTSAVLTPFTHSAATPAGTNTWVKKVLPVGQISYKGRLLEFTPDYLKGLAEAFTSQAYDQVPFQLAPGDNSHTNDPERYRGQITAMDARPDGLYVTLSATEAGSQIIRENPQLGVSARIVEDYDRADGKFYPAAVQHVLGTLDPRIPGLGTWSAIEAANAGDQMRTLDLSGYEFAGETKEGTMPDLNPEQQARLATLLDIPADRLAALVEGLAAPELTDAELQALAGTPSSSEDVMSDEELDELMAAAAELEESGQLEGASLSGGDEALMAIELATARADQNAIELSAIRAKLDNEEFLSERRRLADAGVPPYITDLATDLLKGSGHVVELSNGKAADAGAIMRRVLNAVGKLSGMLDLSFEEGSVHDEPAGAAAGDAASHRSQVVSLFKQQTGL